MNKKCQSTERSDVFVTDNFNTYRCVMCGTDAVVSSYLGNQRYRYKCRECGQFFEFNATSWLAADLIWKHYISGR